MKTLAVLLLLAAAPLRADELGGEACLAEWFKAARAADPQARLVLNDDSILETGRIDYRHQEEFFRIAKKLLDDGAPLGALGLQGHFSDDLTPIPRLLEILDRFAKLGLPLEVTEHDINLWDEALAGAYTRDFLTMMFSHPSVEAVLTWGFWEGRHWIPNAALLRRDWTPRPAGQAWLDLVKKEWWTNAELETDARGEARLRGFLGDYEISAGGATAKASLPKAGARIEVALP